MSDKVDKEARFKEKQEVFLPAIRKSFETANAIRLAVFRAMTFAKRQSQKESRYKHWKDGYIDKIELEPWIEKIGTMTLKMVTVRSFLEQAGLKEWVSSAMERVLNETLGPEGAKKTTVEVKEDTKT